MTKSFGDPLAYALPEIHFQAIFQDKIVHRELAPGRPSGEDV
ncbi:MAG: hypothetical protein ACRCTR_07950 [Actinomycetota bacterium]